MPKNEPWQRAAMIRPSSITPYVGASADSRLPTTNSATKPTRTGFWGSPAVAAVTAIAPTATVSA